MQTILLHRTNLNRLAVRVLCLPKYLQSNAKPKYLENFKLKSNIASPVASLNTSHPFIHLSAHKHFSTNPGKDNKDDLQEDVPPEKLTLFKRYKKMFKEYWYVLLPVHGVTSVLWFGSFYYASTCGLDIIPFLEYINLPETLIEPLRKSSLGHIAVASALYKLATPARYMVTLGGSTFAVNILKKRGLIRPVPTKAEIKTIIQNKLKKDGASEKDN